MNKEQQKALKNLVRLNLDAREGYKTAAENSNDSLLNTFFDECSLERQTYAEKLANAANIDIKDVSTDLQADLHRFWMDVKTSSQKFNAKAVLKECERGEKHAIKEYDKVLNEIDLPGELRSDLENQRRDIESKFEHILDLEDNYDDTDDNKNRETPVP